MSGSLGILNVGTGDTKLVFDKNNPAETIRAGRIVKDMLRRGYALIVEVGKEEDGKPRYQRVEGFDENTSEYIIADFDPVVAMEADKREEEVHEQGGEASETQEIREDAPQSQSASTTPSKGKRGRYRKTVRQKRIDASTTTGTAIARSAGG